MQTNKTTPMTPEERLDALAEAFAEGFIYLSEQGLLDGFDDNAPSEAKPKQT